MKKMSLLLFSLSFKDSQYSQMTKMQHNIRYGCLSISEETLFRKNYAILSTLINFNKNCKVTLFIEYLISISQWYYFLTFKSPHLNTSGKSKCSVVIISSYT